MWYVVRAVPCGTDGRRVRSGNALTSMHENYLVLKQDTMGRVWSTAEWRSTVVGCREAPRWR